MGTQHQIFSAVGNQGTLANEDENQPWVDASVPTVSKGQSPRSGCQKQGICCLRASAEASKTLFDPVFCVRDSTFTFEMFMKHLRSRRGNR
jgi:hypothetical protein